MKFWVAMNPKNEPIPWTVRRNRGSCIQQATECRLAHDNYDRLGNRSARWAFPYRQDYRVVRATLTIDHVKTY